VEFFVTFGQQYTREPNPGFEAAHPDGWLVIEANSLEDARSAVAHALGNHWSNLYTKEEFMTDAARLYPRGELGRITSTMTP
jgi:hypothetical protein